jgi:hypothetical protein
MIYKIIKTKIKGFSTFSNVNLKSGELIGDYLTKTPNNVGKHLVDLGLWESEICRYTNHSSTPNTEIIKENEVWKIYSIREIEVGDEFVVDYVDVAIKLGINPNTFYQTNFIEYNLTKFGELEIKLI